MWILLACFWLVHVLIASLLIFEPYTDTELEQLQKALI